MRTKGQGYVAINPNPKGGGWASAMGWAAKYYQQNQTQKNPNFDTIGKLVIQNYAKDLGSGVFWGWDVISADETDEHYLFQLRNRADTKLRVYITLGRVLQYSSLPHYPEMMYQCYIHDDEGSWSSTQWFRGHDITYKNFWQVVEETITNHHLPF
jgi:hypothetical protein